MSMLCSLLPGMPAPLWVFKTQALYVVLAGLEPIVWARLPHTCGAPVAFVYWYQDYSCMTLHTVQAGLGRPPISTAAMSGVHEHA